MLYNVDPETIRQQFYANKIDHYYNLLGGAGPLKNSLPYFSGVYTQRGHGFIGDIFRKFAIPLLQKAKPIALAGVAGIARDIQRGIPFKRAVKRRGKQAIRRVIRGGGKKTTPPKAIRRTRRRRRTTRKSVTNKKFPLFA